MADKHCCTHAAATLSAQQSLDELDFERGMWSAALDGDLDRVRKYLRSGSDPDAVDSSGITALHYAARSGHVMVCELLLDHGANINAQTRSGQATPLHRAAYQGHTEVTRLLLARKADVTLKDSDGMTPLHKAAQRSKVEVCKLLMEKDRSVLATTDKKNRKPFDCVPENDTELKKLLAI